MSNYPDFSKWRLWNHPYEITDNYLQNTYEPYHWPMEMRKFFPVSGGFKPHNNQKGFKFEGGNFVDYSKMPTKDIIKQMGVQEKKDFLSRKIAEGLVWYRSNCELYNAFHLTERHETFALVMSQQIMDEAAFLITSYYF
jgi:hypothetical protein